MEWGRRGRGVRPAPPIPQCGAAGQVPSWEHHAASPPGRSGGTPGEGNWGPTERRPRPPNELDFGDHRSRLCILSGLSPAEPGSNWEWGLPHCLGRPESGSRPRSAALTLIVAPHCPQAQLSQSHTHLWELCLEFLAPVVGEQETGGEVPSPSLQLYTLPCQAHRVAPSLCPSTSGAQGLQAHQGAPFRGP